MIIVMKPNAKEEYINNITDRLIEAGLGTNKIVGVDCTVIGIVGDTSKVDRELMATLPGVARVLKVQEPFKRANRAFKKEDTIVDVSGVKIGGTKPVIIAGPCSVESEEQVINIAKSVKAAGASILRGGAFKPRTSPYAFQGLALDGLKILKLAKKQTYLLTNREISYIIITGGSSELPGMSYLVEEIFGENARIGNIDTIGIRSNVYSTVSGLIRCFENKLNLRDKEYTMIDFDNEMQIKNIDLNDSSVLSKVFGYFFDN